VGVGASLRGLNFTEADLAGADLAEANLEGGILPRAHLGGAVLRKANLKRCRLTGASCIGTDFSGTNMVQIEAEDADFSCADLRFAQLIGSNLSGVSFKEALISHADFSEAKLGGSNFGGAVGEGAKFTGQLHLKVVLAASAWMATRKKDSKQTEKMRDMERQARIAQLEREARERDRSVATREPQPKRPSAPSRELTSPGTSRGTNPGIGTRSSSGESKKA
jgi:hypothetical protein